MREPEEPSKEDCCNSGCNPCVFDVYDKEMTLFRNYPKNEKGVLPIQENGITQLDCTRFLVMKKENICSNHVLIHFKRVSPDVHKIWWKPGHHFLYKYKSDERSCTRAYTPVKSDIFGQEDYDFSVIIKKYDNGLVSTILFNVIQEGDETLWRGPYGHYEIIPNKFTQIILLAQGTGILPFISIIQNILNNEDDMSKIYLLYCCKSVESILFREYIYDLKSYWNFDYEIFLSHFVDKSLCKYQEPLHSCKLNDEYIIQLKPCVNTNQILICGSPPFMNHYKTVIGQDFPPENIILF